MPSGFLSFGIIAAVLMVIGGGIIALTGGIGAVAIRLIQPESTAAEGTGTCARLRTYGVEIMGTGIILWIFLYILLTFS